MDELWPLALDPLEDAVRVLDPNEELWLRDAELALPSELKLPLPPLEELCPPPTPDAL